METNEPDTPSSASTPDTPPAAAPSPAPAPPRTKKNRAWILWTVIILLGIGLVMSVTFNFGLAMSVVGSGGGMASLGGKRGASDEYPQFTAEHSWGSGKTKVIRMGLSGAIFRMGEPTLFGPGQDKVESLLRQIRAATHDQDVKGIIFEVNSPGGAVTPSDEIYNAFKKFKDSDPSRVVVVHMRDLAASGGYYASMASDHIVAEPTTIVGSIGVIMQAYNFQKLAEKVGVSDTTIKSGPNKDLLNPFREVDPEDVALLQVMVDSMQERFVSIVQAGRNLPVEHVKKIADGRVLTSGEALKEKLIDEIGYWDEVVAAMEKKLGGKKISIYRYEGRPTLMDVLYGAQARKAKSPSLLDLQVPRLLYLYRP